ncbi:glycosyltransferase family 87 protein [Actibacterium sp. 188UL27-1]|uniref:glycosyltransferase family 87 protein n=1 Tax=Actibacterium sp. 188UL27-1 TaxID=2786961 RepID=UPI00195812BA|nr:glycosyltransferase family 87 protein [Actibacterium sp. 188UL27-1]MBM7066700.1 DUF2029 domain-containing protein [Actibacterium sp. 188UL27-1]
MLARQITGEISDMLDPGCIDVSVDFAVFWGAGHLAAMGEPLAAFSVNRIYEANDATCPPDWFPFLHPPAFLALMTPLGVLPFPVAWIIFSGVSFAVYAAALGPFCKASPSAWVALACAPAVIPVLAVGQFTLLWAGVFLAAFAALRADRPWSAGILIGVLTLKPTLGLMIPAALIAIGAWRATAGAAMTSVILNVAATLIYGPAYWTNLVDIYTQHAARLEETLPLLDLMTSIPALLTRLGISYETAVTLQWGLSALLAGAVFVIWRSKEIGFDAKMAALAAATCLATPYFWHYDAGLLAVVALFLLRSDKVLGTPLTMVAAVLLWMGPALPIFVPVAPAAVMIPPLIGMAVILSFASAVQRVKTA